MVVELTVDEVRRALARVAIEKANAEGWPYRWGDHVQVFGPAISGVRIQLRDGYDARVTIALDAYAGTPRCGKCGKRLDDRHPEGWCDPW
jgi:hypothetical protein